MVSLGEIYGGWVGLLYPLAAWRPRPLDPPVTTATFPSSEKMLPKSSSWTSSLAEPMLAAAPRLPCV
jgi:hypothetical protein